MFEYHQNFQPSQWLLKFWLYTRKAKRTSYDVYRPGLFDDPVIIWSALGFMFIIILEGIATMKIYRYVDIDAILISILLDIILAVIAHLFNKPIVIYRNKMVYADAKEKDSLALKIKALKSFQIFFYLLIIVNGFFKFYWFFRVYQSFDVTTILVFVAYMLGAILHIFSTGYFLFTLAFYILFTFQKLKYRWSGQKKFVAGERSSDIDANVPLEEVRVGKHTIYKDKNKYVLKSRGILLDEQLDELIGRQRDPQAQKIVGTQGVKHQLKFIGVG